MGIKYREGNMPELNDLNEMSIKKLEETCKNLDIGVDYDSCTGKITGYGDQEYPEEVNFGKYGIEEVK